MNAFLQRLPVVGRISILLSPFIILPLFLYAIVQVGREPSVIPDKVSDILFFGVAPLTAFAIFYIIVFSFHRSHQRKIISHLSTFLISVILESVCIYISIIILVILSPAAASL
jgi:hypothetical protein